jgi:Fe-Mn family superoxide dismutase
MHLTRREMLQAAGAGVATLALPPLAALAQAKAKTFTLPKLPYPTDALEPYIDAKTMQIHHGGHHLAYVNTANGLIEKAPELKGMSADEVLANIDKAPKEVRQGLINNVGGHSNHSIFWVIMGPPKGSKKPTGALAKDIDKAFGSFDKFQKQLSNAGQTQFGSGWAWLVVNKKGELEVVQRKNQDSPILDGLKPIFGVDVWEHAYYLKYQNRRPEYIKAWWNVVNWKAVSDRVAKAKKA